MSEKPVASIKALARYKPDTVYIGTGEYVAECVRADDGDYYLATDVDAAIETLRAEVDRLNRYYKNGIDCFANPCERHSGERTPPFAEFFEKYGGQCLICVVDNNKALQAERDALREALLRQVLEAVEGFVNITNDSQGVAGYHLNGDTAEWDEFDEVDAARSAIEAIRNHLGSERADADGRVRPADGRGCGLTPTKTQ